MSAIASAFLVRRFRIENALVAEFELRRAQHAVRQAERHGAIETRTPAGMTGAGDLFDFDPHRVLIAVDAHFDDALGVARSLTLFPQRLARPTEIPRFAGGDGF